MWQSRWRGGEGGEVQSLEEGCGGCHRGAEFSRVTAVGKKLFLNLLVRVRNDPVTPPRGEEGKQSVAGVRAVPDDAARPVNHDSRHPRC